MTEIKEKQNELKTYVAELYDIKGELDQLFNTILFQINHYASMYHNEEIVKMENENIYQYYKRGEESLYDLIETYKRNTLLLEKKENILNLIEKLNRTFEEFFNDCSKDKEVLEQSKNTMVIELKEVENEIRRENEEKKKELELQRLKHLENDESEDSDYSDYSEELSCEDDQENDNKEKENENINNSNDIINESFDLSENQNNQIQQNNKDDNNNENNENIDEKEIKENNKLNITIDQSIEMIDIPHFAKQRLVIIQSEKEEQSNQTEKAKMKRKRKTKKVTKKTHKRKSSVMTMSIIVDQQKEIERNFKIQNIISIEEMKKIEEWSEMFVDEILFDSTINNWKQKGLIKKESSEFDSILLNKQNIIILIYLETNHFIGAYIDNQINEYSSKENNWKGIESQNAFVFQSKENVMKKYRIAKEHSDCAFKLMRANDETLFEIGKKDIVIKKENKKDKSFCKQEAFNYKGKENVFMKNGEQFTPSRIVVLQMYETDEVKKLKQKLQIEEWCGKKYKTVLFDSSIDNWKKYRSQLQERVLNKSQLLFLIETEDDITVGGYINAQITADLSWIADPNAFIFTFKDNKSQKFTILPEKQHKAFYLWPSGSDWLFDLGGNDLSIYVNGRKSDCFQNDNSSFDYRDVSHALIGRSGIPNGIFGVKRIYVIQME